jgi:branched-chain amino acid transport system permease protein
MPMIGGTTSWVGPLVGALLLGSAQQYITVNISSAVGVLVVGLMLIIFVIAAPKGIVGLVQDFMRERASDQGQPTWRSRLAIFANMRPGAR